MEIRITILLSMSLLCLDTWCQQVHWEKSIDMGQYYEAGGGLAYSSKGDGSFIISGSSLSSQLTNDLAFTGRISTTGDTSNINFNSAFYPDLYYVYDLKHVGNEGNYIGLASKDDGSGTVFQSTIVKIDENGDIIWETEYNVGYESWSEKMVVLPDQTTFCSGYIGGAQRDVYLNRIDRLGNVVFEKQINAAGLQFSSGISLNSDGALWICGTEKPVSSFSSNPFILKLAADGSIIAKDTLPDLIPSDSNGAPSHIFITPDHYILFEWVVNTNESQIIKTDTNYNIVWQTPANQEVGSPLLLADNKVFTFGDNNVKLYDYSTGNLLWTKPSTTLAGTEHLFTHAFGDSGEVVFSGSIEDGEQNLYFLKINGVGTPASFDCANGAAIDSMYANVQGTSFLNLGAAASEFLKYSDVLAYNWYLQDGTQLYGQYQSHNFDNVAFPDTFWCMLVVTDAIGCSDTLTLNAYTGDTLANPNWPLPDAIDEVVSSNNSISVYPNPFDDRITIQFSQPIKQNTPVEVFDIIGRSYKVPVTYSAQRLIIDGEKLPQGMYVVVLDKQTTFKVVKQ